MYKIYYKNGGYNLYKTIDGKTLLIKSVSKYGKETTYTWIDTFLNEISNEYGENLLLSYDDNGYLLDIINLESQEKVTFTYYGNLMVSI